MGRPRNMVVELTEKEIEFLEEVTASWYPIALDGQAVLLNKRAERFCENITNQLASAKVARKVERKVSG